MKQAHTSKSVNSGRYAFARGFSLIELMIALVLGLLVVLSAIAIFAANGRTYRTTENIGRIQENARTAFELIGRDLREAGGQACDSTEPPTSMLNSAQWWTNVRAGVQLYPDASTIAKFKGQAGTQALEVVSATSPFGTVRQKMASKSEALSLNEEVALPADQMLLVCDFACATLFKATNSGAKVSTVEHAKAVTPPSGVPPLGNAAATLACSKDAGGYMYGPDSVVSRVQASRWQIQPTRKGQLSLVRYTLDAGGNFGAMEEVARGVTNLSFEYLRSGDTQYQLVSAATAPVVDANILAVRVTLTLTAKDAGNGEINTRMQQVFNLRNRAVKL